MKRISILLITVILLSSCEYTDSGGTCDTEDVTKFYDIQDIQANGLIYLGGDKDKHNLWQTSSRIDLNSKLEIEAIRFIIELDANFTEKWTKNKLHETFNLSPINTAIALSCIPATVILKTYEVISKLVITSDANFDSNHPIGTSLNDLFIVKYAEGTGVNSKFNFDSNSNTNINEFVLASPPGMRKMHLMLSAAPELVKTHNFKIVYMHTNGDRFEKYLGPIIFK